MLGREGCMAPKAKAPKKPPKFHRRRKMKPPPPEAPLSCQRARSEHATEHEKQTAKLSFVREGASIAAISRSLGRSFNTVKSWSQEDGWEPARRAFLASAEGAADILQNQLLLFLNDVQAGKYKLTAALAKTVREMSFAIKTLREDRLTPTMYFTVLQEFVGHLSAAEPELLPKLEAHVETFLTARRKLFLAGGKI